MKVIHIGTIGLHADKDTVHPFSSFMKNSVPEIPDLMFPGILQIRRSCLRAESADVLLFQI